MSSGHLFDRYLSQAKGAPAAQKTSLGNSLLEQAKTAAGEWQSSLEHFVPAPSDLVALPEGSWLLKFAFRLARPFTSKSEAQIHHYQGQHEVQNPIVRDHLTGLPMVRPTTWKGHLRFAAGRVHGIARKGHEPEVLTRLFGETRGEEGGMEGRLRFFPTFFTANVQREVITPLKRDTRTPARGPIDIEVAPAGAEGTFCLLYLPLPRGQDCSLAQIAEDLQAIASALRAMFLDYGFSAKKTAGWGLAEDTAQEGYLWAKGQMWPPLKKRGEGGPAQPYDGPNDTYIALMDEAGMPKAGLRKSDGTWLSNKEFNALTDKPCSLSVYRRFRIWYDSHGEEWRRRQSGTARSAGPVFKYSFPSMTRLEALLNELAQALHREDASG